MRPRAALAALLACRCSGAAAQQAAAGDAGQASQGAALQASAADGAWQSADWQSSEWASADGESSDWDYACSVPLSLGEAELAFVDQPGDTSEARLERAAAFAGAHGLDLDGGCASAVCVAALLVSAVDSTVCAALFRARVVFVHVGFSCVVAGVLRHNGMRGAAFPFDWSVSSLDAVNGAIGCALRANDAGACADGWFARLRFDTPSRRIGDWTASGGGSSSAAETIVVLPAVSFVAGHVDGTHTPVLFSHDFAAAAAADVSRVFAKYARRFRRLARLLRRGGGPRVYLVLYPVTEKEQETLTDYQRAVYANVGVDGDALLDGVVGARQRDVAALRSLVADRPHVSVVDLNTAVHTAKHVAAGR